MRNFFLFLLVAICIQISPAVSQNQANKNSIHAKLNFIDYGLLYDNKPNLGQGFEFAYFRNIAPMLNIGIPFKLGLAKLPGSTEGNTLVVGADVQFRLENIKSAAKVIPFALGGAGVVLEKGNNHAQFPFGAGLHFRVSPYAFINLQGEFRKALVDDRDNLQISIGYVYLIHKSENKPMPIDLSINDQDKDGTPDSLDVCPTLAGSPTAHGCPDADNDGIGDTEDPCINDAGPAETKGCPDYDIDGFADKDDDCPTEAGTLKGCPDSDSDGVSNKNDKCPDEKGTEANMGCPEKKDTDGDGVPDEEDLCPDKPGTNLGCPDTDRDGVADNLDKCPDNSGTVANNGCPEAKDTDGDGIIDEKDPCPTQAGPVNGCPDADGDGTEDNLDKCPNNSGPAANKGCPEAKDSDGDGIIDEKDLCPTQPGPIKGCPDADGDGIADNLDKCPNNSGPAANKGCPDEKKPVVKQEEKPAPIVAVPVTEEKNEIKEAREKLATAARAIQFETAKAILKDASYDVLDEVVAIMRQNGSYSLSISGYTDDVGDDEQNLKLSQDRSKACYDYLIFRGIKADRIRFAGFGEARPIGSNDNEKGREQNRRVEFELILE
jgi:OmpA-OmpF porin, OOP family